MYQICSFEPCADSGQGHLLDHEILGSLVSESLALCSYFGHVEETNENSLACRIDMEYYAMMLVAHGDHCRVSKSFLYPFFRRDISLSDVFLI